MKIIKFETRPYCLECINNNSDNPDSNEREEDCTHEKPTVKHVMLLPGCCALSTQALYPRASVRIGWDSDGNPGGTKYPYWSLPIEEMRNPIWGRGKISFGDFLKEEEGIKHCPFCGTKLPAIVLEDSPPSPIGAYDDCGHCECGWPRSYGKCPCWPTIALYKTE